MNKSFSTRYVKKNHTNKTDLFLAFLFSDQISSF